MRLRYAAVAISHGMRDCMTVTFNSFFHLQVQDPASDLHSYVPSLSQRFRPSDVFSKIFI